MTRQTMQCALKQSLAHVEFNPRLIEEDRTAVQNYIQTEEKICCWRLAAFFVNEHLTLSPNPVTSTGVNAGEASNCKHIGSTKVCVTFKGRKSCLVTSIPVRRFLFEEFWTSNGSLK